MPKRRILISGAALIVGDGIDDFLWAEVMASQFVVAVSVLMATHTVFDFVRCRLGEAR